MGSQFFVVTLIRSKVKQCLDLLYLSHQPHLPVKTSKVFPIQILILYTPQFQNTHQDILNIQTIQQIPLIQFIQNTHVIAISFQISILIHTIQIINILRIHSPLDITNMSVLLPIQLSHTCQLPILKFQQDIQQKLQILVMESRSPRRVTKASEMLLSLGKLSFKVASWEEKDNMLGLLWEWLMVMQKTRLEVLLALQLPVVYWVIKGG